MLARWGPGKNWDHLLGWLPKGKVFKPRVLRVLKPLDVATYSCPPYHTGNGKGNLIFAKMIWGWDMMLVHRKVICCFFLNLAGRAFEKSIILYNFGEFHDAYL